jgi:hypothetical protein
MPAGTVTVKIFTNGWDGKAAEPIDGKKRLSPLLWGDRRDGRVAVVAVVSLQDEQKVHLHAMH